MKQKAVKLEVEAQVGRYWIGTTYEYKAKLPFQVSCTDDNGRLMFHVRCRTWTEALAHHQHATRLAEQDFPLQLLPELDTTPLPQEMRELLPKVEQLPASSAEYIYTPQRIAAELFTLLERRAHYGETKAISLSEIEELVDTILTPLTPVTSATARAKAQTTIPVTDKEVDEHTESVQRTFNVWKKLHSKQN